MLVSDHVRAATRSKSQGMVGADYVRAMGDVLLCRNTEGETVAEVDFGDTALTLPEIIDRARALRASILWAHGSISGEDVLEAKPGYARLRAEQPVAGDPLPLVEPGDYAALMGEAYAGMWGHKWVDPAESLPTDGSVVLSLAEDGVPIGLCRVWPAQRLVDQPGVVPEHREPRHQVRLLAAACALLGPGPVDVDTWGESPHVLDAYGRLGFVVTERLRGWELRL